MLKKSQLRLMRQVQPCTFKNIKSALRNNHEADSDRCSKLSEIKVNNLELNSDMIDRRWIDGVVHELPKTTTM